MRPGTSSFELEIHQILTYARGGTQIENILMKNTVGIGWLEINSGKYIWNQTDTEERVGNARSQISKTTK